MLLFNDKQLNTHWRNNLLLFVCILVLFLIGPYLLLDELVPFITSLFFTLLVISSIFVIEYSPAIRKILVYTGITVITMVWLEFFFSNGILRFLSFFLLAFYLFSITISLIVHVAVSKDVNANIIFSAINGYLLVGIIGGISLLIIAQFTKGPILSNIQADKMADYMYFSFVTLTTLGYGDLTPVTGGSRVIAMLLATTGQLYIAILIAMLVGKFLNKSNQ